jgi:hypothetical protein
MPGQQAAAPEIRSPIVGTAYTAQSKNLAGQRAVNLYVESVEDKQGTTPAGLFLTPGTSLITTTGTGAIRPGGMTVLNDVLYVVSGNELLAVNSNYTVNGRGYLQTASGPVSMINNGPTYGQVAISDGAAIYCFNQYTDTLTTPALPGGLPGSLVYQDTLGVFAQPGSQFIWQSNPGDLSTWNALNFSAADGSAGAIVGLSELARQTIVHKTDATEFWINAGNLGFVFQRLQGVYPNTGCLAAASIVWLGQDEHGMGTIYICGGYEPKRVSTYAIEYQLSTYATLADAYAWTYSQAGHRFYVINFPTAGKTWALDLTESTKLGMPAWHERADTDANGNFIIHEPCAAALFNETVVVGSSTSSNLYAYSPATLTNNGNPKKWLRSWRAFGGPVQRKSRRMSFMELEYESGVNVPAVGAPIFVLRYSDDDGHSWSSEFPRAAGLTGQTSAQTRWNRMGSVRRGINTDRVLELSSVSDATNQMKLAILGVVLS